MTDKVSIYRNTIARAMASAPHRSIVVSTEEAAYRKRVSGRFTDVESAVLEMDEQIGEIHVSVGEVSDRLEILEARSELQFASLDSRMDLIVDRTNSVKLVSSDMRRRHTWLEVTIGLVLIVELVHLIMVFFYVKQD